MGMCFLPASFFPAKAPSSGAPATKDRKERRETLSCFSITHSTLPQKSTCFSRRDLIGQSFGRLRSRLRSNQLACDTATRWEAEAAESPGAAGSQKSSGAQVERRCCHARPGAPPSRPRERSEEHTSELQSLTNLVCRLLLEKKKDT